MNAETTLSTALYHIPWPHGITANADLHKGRPSAYRRIPTSRCAHMLSTYPFFNASYRKWNNLTVTSLLFDI